MRSGSAWIAAAIARCSHSESQSIGRALRAFLMASCVACGADHERSAPAITGRIEVREDDPIWPALLAYQARVEAEYEEHGCAAEFLGWSAVESPVLATLFPDLRFASVMWNERALPGVRVSGLTSWLCETIAVDDSGHGAANLWNLEQGEAFGKLLAARRIRVRNRDDAEAVGSAFALLHTMLWQGEAVQRSATLWHVSIDAGQTYLELVLDENELVASARIRVETVEPLDDGAPSDG